VTGVVNGTLFCIVKDVASSMLNVVGDGFEASYFENGGGCWGFPLANR